MLNVDMKAVAARAVFMVLNTTEESASITDEHYVTHVKEAASGYRTLGFRFFNS